MAEQTSPGTRARILEVALEEFAARGYQATSVRLIAERVGVTKTAVLYHFPGKADIVDALAEPMLSDMEAAMAAADLPDPAEARWAALEGLLQVWLRHRYLLRMNLHDLAMASAGVVFQRFRDSMVRANVLVAGPAPDFARRVRAAQAIAMLSDPVVLFADAPVEDLRARILDGVHRLLGDGSRDSVPEAGDRTPVQGRRDGTSRPDDRPSPRSAASSHDVGHPAGVRSSTDVGEDASAGRASRSGRVRRGRPGVMTSAMAETARRMYDAGSPAAEIAVALGVSRATIYRYLPGGGQ